MAAHKLIHSSIILPKTVVSFQSVFRYLHSHKKEEHTAYVLQIMEIKEALLSCF